MANKYNFSFTTPPPITPKWGSAESLGSKVETMFLRFIQRVVSWGYEFIASLFVDIFDASMKIMRPGIAKATDPIIQAMMNMEDTPAWFKNAMNTALTETGESSWIMKFMIFYTTMTAAMTGGLEPVRRIVSYRADVNFRSYLPSPQELAALLNVGLVSEQGFTDNMKKLGVADPLIPVYKEYSRNLIAVGDLFQGLWRGVYSEGEFSAYLKRMGYNEKDISAFQELSKNIPPVQDLIRFLVRDAFNPQAINAYGYGEDYPTDLDQWFRKQGYDPDWAKRYWYAHWNLPSPQQAYEMLHRNLINQDDLDVLLKISDYPPFWREKLRDISYNVLTRVDVRRLLQAGIIDESKALDTYKKMGYTPDDAKLLTDFAAKGITQDEKDLTKSDVLNLYEEGLTSRDDTKSNLVKMGYDSQEADEILQLSDVAIAKAMRTDLINYTKEKFLAKQIDENGARGELNQIGLKQQSVDRYVMNWLRASEVEAAIPSIADVKRWYVADYIDETKLRSYLAQHKHTPENIELYVQEINDKKAQAVNEQAL